MNLKPTGQHYMEDFHAAGGVGAVLRELKPLLHLTCRSVTGETLEERLNRRAGFCRSFGDPFDRGAVSAYRRTAGPVRQPGPQRVDHQVRGGR